MSFELTEIEIGLLRVASIKHPLGTLAGEPLLDAVFKKLYWNLPPETGGDTVGVLAACALLITSMPDFVVAVAKGELHWQAACDLPDSPCCRCRADVAEKVLLLLPRVYPPQPS